MTFLQSNVSSSLNMLKNDIEQELNGIKADVSREIELIKAHHSSMKTMIFQTDQTVKLLKESAETEESEKKTPAN